MSKTLWIGVVIVVLVGAFFMLKGGDKGANVVAPDNTESESQSSSQEQTQTSDAESAAVPVASNVKSFVVEGENFKFSLSEMRVTKGDTVRLTFKNVNGKHDWKVDEFNAATKIIDGGQEETIEFVADKAGTFEYYCSVGSHRQFGMKGNLIVEE